MHRSDGRSGRKSECSIRDHGDPAEGIDPARDLPGICDYGYGAALHPGRQQMITEIATLSFFESVLAWIRLDGSKPGLS